MRRPVVVARRFLWSETAGLCGGAGYRAALLMQDCSCDRWGRICVLSLAGLAINIKLHVIAPIERQDEAFDELQRPVFSLLEKRRMKESCTYLSYEAAQELAGLKHLAPLSARVPDGFSEKAE